MKEVILFLAVAITLAGCSKNSINGIGNTVTENRTVAPFAAVQLEGSSQVVINQGTQQKVEVIGYENLLPIYETYVQNGTLVLKFKNNYYNVHNNNIHVNLTISDLSKISINGSGALTIKNFNANTLSALINGSGDISAENAVYNKVSLKINGSGKIKGQELKAKQAETEINGSGIIDINCTESLNATIHGSGEINYWGNPSGVSVNVSGSGRVRKK